MNVFLSLQNERMIFLADPEPIVPFHEHLLHPLSHILQLKQAR
jgi:hypothetical protein